MAGPLTIGLLHPGEMGSAVGAAAKMAGAQVLWASHNRSPRTAERAAAEGFTDRGGLKALVQESEVILSVCPPHAAVDLARDVAAQGFRGLYLDLNAIAPATARTVRDVVEAGGAECVDGGIVGSPPRTPGTTRLYLSGRSAPRAAAIFAGSPLEAIVLGEAIGAASALKMTYAAWSKGTSALVMAIRAVAAREGVDAALVAEWERSQPGLAARSAGAAQGSAYKAWRWVGEMEEIAATFEAAGLPGGFHHAAAEVFRALAGYKDTPTPPSVEQVSKELLGRH